MISFAFLEDHSGCCWRAGWKDGHRHRHELLMVVVAQVRNGEPSINTDGNSGEADLRDWNDRSTASLG